MQVQLIEDGQDTGRRIVPYNTGRVQIGSAYVPKPCPVTAVCIERYTPKRNPVLRWIGWCAFALLALGLIAGRA